ncbi:MAG: phage tail protein [Kofleriaceae bacterium]|nr:MAG: phage tail protein [Kofleriaceae bacterium]MBZ0236777.1 phage tail protein [Kofleriaceae bacterium]
MTRKDPFLAFCFRVTIQDKVSDPKVAFFKSVSGLSYETEVVEHREGGDNNSTRKLVGGTKWKNITLKRGFASKELISWREEWLKPIGPGPQQRKWGTIEQLSADGKTVVAKWTFYKGWPVKWELSELDASKSEVSIETLEIAHEGLSFG